MNPKGDNNMGPSTPDATPDPSPSAPPTRVFLVDVSERRSYVVRVPEAVLNLPPGTPEAKITEHVARTADLMVSNDHPDAVRTDAIRVVLDINPLQAT